MDKSKEEIPQEGDFKIKKKRGRPRKLQNNDDVVRLKVTEENKEDAVQTQEANDSNDVVKEPTNEINSEKMAEEVRSTETEEVTDVSPLVEITEEEQNNITQPTVTNTQPEIDLPENIEKLVNFMKDTGGTVEDYVRLNADYSTADDVTLLKEYYKQSKPHLDAEEIEFMLNDRFAYNEDEDEEREVRKRKLAIKEEVAKAKNFLEETKSKYYDQIKLRPGVTQEQQKAIDFFNRYNNEQEKVKETRNEFINKTNQFFKNDFKGFDFDLGDKKVRYNVNNPQEVANAQSDITNFFEMFLDDKGAVTDYNKYHKSLFAARNIDTIVKHVYEQGKADAIKQEFANSKNIPNKARTEPSGDSIYLNGMKIKAVSGINSQKLKIKRK